MYPVSSGFQLMYIIYNCYKKGLRLIGFTCLFVLHEKTAKLGPYDLQESRTKMSGGASPSSALPKKKKKSDAKGQSQLNKCRNEKRRREQENIYIEELAELISASFADMNSLSVKPDKCAILQETVNQVRAGTHRLSSDQTESLISTEAAVQQGEVSSSKPTRISNTELAPLLLSALDGFLFVVNADSQIEFVTENIQQFLHYNKEELLGKSVYNIIHHGDHTKFGVLLNNPLLIYDSPIGSLGSNVPTTPLMEQSPSGSKGNNWNQRFTKKFNCRLLIKPPSDQDQTIEEKQTRVSQYETLQISSTKINGGMVDDEDSTDGVSQNLLCIARRVPYNEKHLSPPLEQFTIKLDQNGKILALDTKDVSEVYAQHINKDCLVGRLLHDKCHKNDVIKVANHLQETRRAGFGTSPVYKLHLVEDKYVKVQTKSKYFKSNENHEMDFIMAAHSIIVDSEMCAMIENNSARAAAEQMNASFNGTDPLSLMSNSVGSNQSVSILQSESKFGNDYNMTPSSDLNFSDFGLFPSTTFGDMLQENKWSEPSTNSVEAPSRTTPVPSPATVSSNPHTPVAQTQYSSFPFSPLIPSPKDSYDSCGSVDRMESARLRTLLMKRTDGSSEDNNVSKNKHNILKGLLNPDDMASQSADDESTNHSTPPSPANVRQASRSNSNMNDSPSTPNNATTSNNNNNMLIKLLNDKSEDEDIEARAGLKKQNDLLQQLLKDDDNVRQHGIMLEQNNQHSNEDLLLNSVGFRILSPTSPDSHNHGRKRNSISADDENDHPPLKRTNSSGGSSGPSVLESMPSPSGSQAQVTNSKLRERNKMLASLLAKDPPPTAIPAIPASVISATPQDKLVTIIKHQQQQQQQQQQQSAGGWNMNSGQHSMTSSSVQTQLQSHQRILLQKSGNNLYLNHMLDQPQALQSQNQIQLQQMRQVTSSAISGYSSLLSNIAESNSNSLPFNSDPELSDLLEEVMDIMNVTSDNSTLLNLFNVLETPNVPNPVGQNTTNQNSYNSLMNEKMAVNAIQKSLMQVESTVESPSPLNYGSPTGSNHHAQNQFIPPPAYQPQQKNSVRFNPQQSPRPPYPKNVQTPPLQQQQLLLQQQQQQKQRLIQQQQQKQRLLQQQQQQKIMVVTTNAATLPTPDPTTALQTIDSLLNNTGPPNVALQRSSSVPDSQSQLSPVYAAPCSVLLNSSQISPSSNRQPPYSTLTQQSFPMLNYGTTTQTQTTTQAQQIVQQATSRMSPSSHSQYQNPINPCVSQQQQTQNIYNSQTQQPGVWTQQRLTLHQQQNPMLNAQLQITGGFNNSSVRQNFLNQQQQSHGSATRVLTSPVGYNTEVPPNTNCQPQQQQQQQQFRLPRNINMTTTNSQIQGGNNGVTEFTRNELRAFVGVRSQQQGITRLSNQLLPGQNVNSAELDSLGLNFDMSPTGGNESPKWSSLNSDLSSSSPQPQGMPARNPMNDSPRTSSANSTTNVTDQKSSSLLQKLLSEK
ncbi:nuclear receptor coactivator 3-like isoform X3 [Metopolophium dirhodum]|uniref:nuclear receptor coactivator 3-like isoform X3 n=2 Tax=Metopolophium dirhodum TaxID=44670 RepID=UPI0029901637|nr:nuclear receptor coactivator 3-like isoform X3 [Metopolophium dirhodum]